jgi:branched-chain amino acid aminotransferase
MPIAVYQINPQGVVKFDLPDLSSLDAVTRQLPDGYYSTFRTYDGGKRVVGLRTHLGRLYKPIRESVAQPRVLRAKLASLLKDYPNEARVRLMMTKGGQIYIALEKLKPLPNEVYERGVRAVTTDLARNHPRLKSTAFISASGKERERVASEGAFEALLIKDGKILEGMTSNFFYVQTVGKKRALGAASRNILLGVTRKTVIHVARGLGFTMIYQPLELNRINGISEAFITSSSRGIVPVVQIDETIIADGKVGRTTRELWEAYQAYVLRRAEEIVPTRGGRGERRTGRHGNK